MAPSRRDTNRDSATTSENGRSKRRCRTAPAPTIIRLHQDLEPNENHPLFGVDPVRREAERQQLFATILARLANGPAKENAKQSTMEDEDTTESNRNNGDGEK
jgi:hypothetical protein